VTARNCPSELVLDRLAVGELAGARHEPIRVHVTSCVRCTGRMDARAVAAMTFVADVGLDVRVAATARAVDAVRSARARRAALIAAGAVAAAVAIVLSIPRERAEEASHVRTKGGLSLGLVAKRLDGRIESLTSPAQLAPGEAIELTISTESAGFVVVVGVDAAGVISPYAPARHLAPGPHQLLDGSIVLDATLGPERIFAVSCDTEIETEVVAEWARLALARAGGNPARIDALALPAACTQASFSIEKAEM